MGVEPEMKTNRVTLKKQKAHRPAPLAGRGEVGFGYENLLDFVKVLLR